MAPPKKVVVGNGIPQTSIVSTSDVEKRRRGGKGQLLKRPAATTESDEGGSSDGSTSARRSKIFKARGRELPENTQTLISYSSDTRRRCGKGKYLNTTDLDNESEEDTILSDSSCNSIRSTASSRQIKRIRLQEEEFSKQTQSFSHLPSVEYDSSIQHEGNTMTHTLHTSPRVQDPNIQRPQTAPFVQDPNTQILQTAPFVQDQITQRLQTYPFVQDPNIQRLQTYPYVQDQITQTLQTPPKVHPSIQRLQTSPFVQDPTAQRLQTSPFVQDLTAQRLHTSPFVQDSIHPTTQRLQTSPFVQDQTAQRLQTSPFVQDPTAQRLQTSPFVQDPTAQRLHTSPFVQDSIDPTAQRLHTSPFVQDSIDPTAQRLLTSPFVQIIDQSLQTHSHTASGGLSSKADRTLESAKAQVQSRWRDDVVLLNDILNIRDSKLTVACSSYSTSMHMHSCVRRQTLTSLICRVGFLKDLNKSISVASRRLHDALMKKDTLVVCCKDVQYWIMDELTSRFENRYANLACDRVSTLVYHLKNCHSPSERNDAALLDCVFGYMEEYYKQKDTVEIPGNVVSMQAKFWLNSCEILLYTDSVVCLVNELRGQNLDREGFCTKFNEKMKDILEPILKTIKSLIRISELFVMCVFGLIESDDVTFGTSYSSYLANILYTIQYKSDPLTEYIKYSNQYTLMYPVYAYMAQYKKSKVSKLLEGRPKSDLMNIFGKVDEELRKERDESNPKD